MMQREMEACMLQSFIECRPLVMTAAVFAMQMKVEQRLSSRHLYHSESERPEFEALYISCTA